MAIVTLLIISVALWQCRPTAAEISGYIDPSPTNNVGEGDTATFTCTVTGRDTSTQSLLWTLSYRNNGEDRVFLYFPATMTGLIDANRILTPWSHGHYFLSYSETDGMEQLQLRISNVTKGDGNCQFNCVYRTNSQSKGNTTIIFGIAVNLAVWTKPTCNGLMKDYLPAVITPADDPFQIILLCTTDPDALTLSWYLTMDDGLRSNIGYPVTFTNQATHFITAADYGREFICEATTMNDPEFKLTCSVVPYHPRPMIFVIPDVLTIQSGESLTAHCINKGVSSSETNYLWYIGNMLLNDIEDEMIHIMETERNSTLDLGKKYLPSGNITITCEAVIPGILSVGSNATVTVTVVPVKPITPSLSPLTTGTAIPGSQSQELMWIMISAAAAGGLLLIIIILILICCFRRNRVGSKTEQQTLQASITKNDSLTRENVQSYHLHQNPDPSNTSTMPNSVSSQPPGSSQSAPPIYAIPNKSRSHKVSLQQDTAEGQLCHYDDVGGGPSYSNAKTSDDVNEPSSTHTRNQFEDEPSAYDDASLSENYSDTLSGTSASKRSANVEGLMYADIEISGTKYSNGNENNDEILETDNITVYSEVKM